MLYFSKHTLIAFIIATIGMIALILAITAMNASRMKKRARFSSKLQPVEHFPEHSPPKSQRDVPHGVPINTNEYLELPDNRTDHSAKVRGEKAMDPWTFVLTVAAGVLATILANLLENETGAEHSSSIKELVSIHVKQGPDSQVFINETGVDKLTTSTLEEVYELARRDEYLDVQRDGDIRLRPELPSSSNEIEFQIRHLKEIVAMRRQELMRQGMLSYQGEQSAIITSTSASSNGEPNSLNSSVEWIDPAPQKSESQLDRVINDMHERIRMRRQGGDR